MGYYTRFNITISDNTDICNIVERLRSISGYDWDYCGDKIYDFCKWYEHEHDMNLLSKEFPDIVFTVTGDGEESDDLWREYWKNGKVQNANRHIVYDEYNEDKLEKWN
jgi:hypothetical protein